MTSPGGDEIRYDRSTLDSLEDLVVGRRRESELVVAALLAGRHLMLEGPPGTGKSTLLRSVAAVTSQSFELVDGNAELTPARLIGHFDPAQVLETGYVEAVWLDGPLTRALREGSILYLEEINRIPEETLNVLVTVMSEGELTIPRLGRIDAHPDFRLVAAMNPFDAVGTARISAAVYDRVCRIGMDYQSKSDELAIAQLYSPDLEPRFVEQVVELVRATRQHREIRVGSSLRGVIDLLLIVGELATLRALEPTSRGVGLDAALTALSGRIRLHESSTVTPEQVIIELWDQIMEPNPAANAESSVQGPPAGKLQGRRAAPTTTGS